MTPDIIWGGIIGAVMATGGWGLVLKRDRKREPNPWRYNPPPETETPAAVVEVPPTVVAAAPTTVVADLEPVIEAVRSIKIEPVPVSLAPLDRILETQQELIDSLYQELKALAQSAEVANKAMAARQEETMACVRDITRTLLEEIDAVRALGPAQFEILVEKLTNVSEQLNATSGHMAKSNGGVSSKLEAFLAKGYTIGGGSGPPIRRDPPPPPPGLPRLAPGQQPVTPTVPAPYVGGTVFVTAGQVANLLLLIQTQLSPNCPGSSAQFSLSTEDSIFIGAASMIGGPLSDTNYAYELTPTNSPRIYRSSFPGNSTPVGELQVFSTAGGELHVEVQS